MEITEADVFTLLTTVRSGLAADGYELEIVGVSDLIELQITAGPEACEDCLVGKEVMKGIMTDAMADMFEDIDKSQIVLHYPTDKQST
jgi:hypothetical protein